MPPISFQAQVPPVYAETAHFLASTVDQEKRTVEVDWYAGATVRIFDWSRFKSIDLTMVLEPAAVDLSRLNSGRAPFLNAHNSFSLQAVLGKFEKAWVEPKKAGKGLVRFSRREDVEPIWQDVVDEILGNVSMGFVTSKLREITKDEDRIPHFLAEKWAPFEASLVPIGRDPDAKVNSQADPATLWTPCQIETVTQLGSEPLSQTTRKVFQMPPEDPSQNTPSSPNAEAGGKPDGAEAGGKPDGAEAGGKPEGGSAGSATLSQTDVDNARKEGASKAGANASQILKACGQVGLSLAFAQELVDANLTLEEAQGRILAKLGSRTDQTVNPSISVGVTEREKIRDGISDYLLHRFDPENYELSEKGRQFYGRPLLELARFCVERNLNRKTDGMAPMDLATLGLYGTSDFPNIASNVAGKSLRRQYEMAPKTFEPLVRTTFHPNFKSIDRVQLGNVSSLEKVGANGEVRRGQVGEGKESYLISTYALILGFTRQMIINDDLDALTRIPGLMGTAAAEMEGDLFWALITGNVTMGDGVALFHANHGNTGVEPLALDGLSEGRTNMRKQTGVGGRGRMNVAPRYLVVPAALETTADQLTSAISPSAQAEVNPFRSTLVPIAESRLDEDSAIAYYLFADKNRIDVGERAYLVGQQGPMVRTREGFDVLGTEIEVVHDVGVAMIDFRGAHKSTGAG